MTLISLYKTVKDTSSSETISLTIFLESIQSGKWQDQVLKIRTIEDKEIKKTEKAKLPNVTISGVFTKRTDKECKLHSGFIAIDIDNLNDQVESIRELLKHDPYIYSIFTSVSGTGLCAIVKIDPEHHRDAFDGIADYFIRTYRIVVDPTGINESRPRFVSYDPDLHINEKSATFKKYLPKKKEHKSTTIFIQDEFDKLIDEMCRREVSCVEDYRDWRDVAFGLAEQFGEAGRRYFHRLSSISSKYDTDNCNSQYDHAVERKERTGKKITIATIYWHAQQAGIEIHSERTNKITAAVYSGKKSNLTVAHIAENLKQHEGITDAEDTINQAYNSQTEPTGTLQENVIVWLRQICNLKRNEITRKIEYQGNPLDDTMLNTLFLQAASNFKKLTFDLFCRIVFSHNITSYNPLKQFLTGSWDGHCRIEQLAKSINSNTGTPEWRELMVTKWLVGVIHSIMGEKSELNFIIVGAKNTGKSEFFRRLLPETLKHYFAESQLNRGKDDEILMCEKLIVFNDEYGGKNKMDERNEKRLMASDEFTLREPYGKANITLKRLACLCGTCNELEVLDDPTGNRRIIVIQAAGKFDFELYNSIDKAQLLYEAHDLWREGARPELKDEDIIEMEATTDGLYSKVSFEEEMLLQYFLPPEKCNPWDFMTTTEVKLFIENHTKERINLNKLGARIRKLGYDREVQGKKYGYQIAKIPPIMPGA